MRDLIRTLTAPAVHPTVPELTLQLATELTPLWSATEALLQQQNMAPPYWAFAWPGSVGLARYLLDHPDLVAGKRVIDVGAGCGVAALRRRDRGRWRPRWRSIGSPARPSP
jgi:predicted nicotinamide N-methyase